MDLDLVKAFHIFYLNLFFLWTRFNTLWVLEIAAYTFLVQELITLGRLISDAGVAPPSLADHYVSGTFCPAIPWIVVAQPCPTISWLVIM